MRIDVAGNNLISRRVEMTIGVYAEKICARMRIGMSSNSLYIPLELLTQSRIDSVEIEANVAITTLGFAAPIFGKEIESGY